MSETTQVLPTKEDILNTFKGLLEEYYNPHTFTHLELEKGLLDDTFYSLKFDFENGQYGEITSLSEYIASDIFAYFSDEFISYLDSLYEFNSDIFPDRLKEEFFL